MDKQNMIPENDTISEEQLLREEAQQRARAQKRMQMKRKKKQQMMMRRAMKIAVPALAVLVILVIGKNLFFPNSKAKSVKGNQTQQENGQGADGGDAGTELSQAGNGVAESAAEDVIDTDGGFGTGETGAEGGDSSGGNAEASYFAQITDQTAAIPEEVVSSYAILVDVKNNTVIAQRDAQTVINPASMTKVLTVLVAAEHMSEDALDDTFTITQEITDFSYKNDCSNVGFDVGEVVTVRDLFYGTILSSGADAAVGLAEYVAGSQDAFVELMNEKLDELGLSETAHFTNCVGLYNEEHHCTVYDMAMILAAALDNDFCREVLSTHVYTTTVTEQHPEGLILSNWFLRRIEDKDAGGFVLAGKTGFVVQSGNCAASCALDGEENRYICVTGNSTSSWRCIYDHVAIYKTFLPQ